jgi:hypothetical protein
MKMRETKLCVIYLILNKGGISLCIRDDQGQFVVTKTKWYSPVLDVDTGEVSGLLRAMKWVKDL